MEKTKIVSNWTEMTEFVENVNPHKECVVVSGFIRQQYYDRFIIKQLVLSTKDVKKVLKNGKKNKKSNKKCEE